ncbi:MAG: RTX toxins and related Ca2+-binding protein, partial [Candidatus Moranbacteria bacterium GW2011_GWC2_37_8]
EASPADPSLAVPVITSIESSFSFNIPPTVSVPVVAPQKTDGTLEITYDINGTKGNGDAALIQNSPWVLLTYQPGVAVTLNADNGTSIVLNKIATSPIPTAGKILIDNELINFTSVSNVTDTTIQLDGLTREYSFNGGVSYITKTSTHAANTTVYFVAENVSGAVEDMTLNGDGSATTGNLITWNPNLADSAEKTIFGGKKLTDMAFKVVANDSDLLNPLNAANPTAANKALDLESPSISSIAADLTTVLEPEKSSGIFGISKTVPVKITFSEPVVTQGDLTIKLDMGNSRVSNCVINISGTAVDNSTCNVTINEGDSSNDLSLISGAAIVGTINDAVSNVTVNPALPVKTDLHDSPDIKVDGVRPTVTSVTETSDNSNNTKKAKPGDKVTLAIATSEELKTDTEPVVTIAGHAATVSGTESPYTAEYTYASTDNVDIEGDIAFTIDLIDTAGNDASPTANENNANINDGTVVFDRTVPTISNISITSNNSLDNKKAKVGDVVSMTFLASEPLQTPVVKIARANDDSPKAADTITNVGQTYTATYTMLVSDKEEDIPYVIEFVDEAENLGGTLTEDSGVIFDRTKPTISQKTAVSNPSNDSTPNYVFATNEAGAITYTGSCTSATLDAIKDGNPTTDNTITFSQLADGTYSNCKIKVTDATGNISDELAVSEFEIDTVGENISINAPATNAHVNSMAIRFAFEETIQSGNIVLTDQSLQQVATAIAADKYADGVEHTQVINGLAEGAYTVAINAIDIAGNAMQTASVSNIVYDTTAPTLSISADNYFNSYAVSSDISISSNNNSEALQSGVITFADRADVLPDMVCNLKQSSLSEGNHSGINLSDECEGSVTLVDGTAYDISFQGTDLAGNSATEIITSKTFDITAPIISSFTSTTSDTCGASACGTTVDDMNITVVMNEPVVSGEMVVRLDNTANPRTDITLNQIASENVVGTYDVLGPNLGHDTDDLSISSVLSSTLTDRAGNVQNNLNIPEGENLNDNKNIVIDTGPPTLVRFSAPEGVYSNDISKNSFTVTAEYSERLSTLNDGSSIDITFNSGKTLTLDNISTDKLTGIYEVSDENVESLAVTQINSQNAVDLIGNPLTSTDLPAQNISGVKIDTVAPSLGSTPIAIQNTSGKTSDMTPQITLDASDNFSFSDDGKVYFKIGDAGSAWCGPINYQATINASSDDLDITSSTCGGNTSNGNKKVVVKFVDSAGNESQIADATVELDKLEPGLEKFTTDTATGIYGSGTSIKIIATYDEPLASGTLVVTLNNGKQITLDAVENENTLTTGDSPYIVGATGSGEDTSALRVASIQSESVSDTSNPANVQSVSNLSGKENLDSNGEAISIDTTAPTAAAGSITLDRYTEDGKIKVSINPSDGGVALDGMAAQIKILTSDSACNFTDASVETFTTFPQTFTYDDTTDSIRKACVKLTDARNNTSGVLEVKAPNTPQQFSYVDLTNDTLTGAILTWKAPIEEGTGLFSKYDLLSCESSDGNACVPSVSHEIASKSQNYYVFNSGLSKSNKYCYNVIFKDLDGNISKSSSTECKVPGEGPVLANTDVDFLALPFVGNITESSANVVFETINKNDANAPLATTAKVEVFTSDDFSVAAYKTVEDALGVIHSVKITGLEQNKKYYLKITATDSTDKSKVLSYGAAVSATTNPGLTFTTAGTLSIIESITESVITDSKAVISFTTNENAKCFIDFKDSLTVTYNDLSANLEKEYAKTHSITLTQLLAKTAYDYKITCSDSNLTQGELDASTDGTAPEISSIALANVTGENATITWTTDEAANSLLAYELDGTDFMLMSGDYLVSLDTKKYTSSHTVQLKGLLPASKYTFTALSTDASGNIGQSTASTFTTKEPSSLSSIKVLSKALGQATISWTTGEPTSSLIEYGLTTSYGSTKEDSSKVKEHLVTLSDLTPGETYHFRVKGEDDLQNIFASSDITFQPKAPPKISDFKVDSITEHGAVVTFNTNVSTDAIVNFENTEKSEDAGFQGRPDYVSKHEIKLKDLTSGATFSVKLKVRDEDGNETEETFPNFTTTKDEVAPKIDRVKTDSALTQNDKVQAIISWSTDELSTGDILYKEGKSGDEKKFEVNSALSFSHIGVITSFKSGVVYYFKVRSTDSAGNTVTSTDYALLTPKQRQNIIQVIVGNFTDIFGWAKF